MSNDENHLTIAELPALVMYRTISKVRSFTTMEAAQFMARRDEDVSAVHNRIKNVAQRGLIQRRIEEGAKPTSPAYFALDDLAAGEVLFGIFDIGVRDAEIANAVSLACYAWDQTLNPRPAYIPEGITPIVAAMVGAAKGESWAARVSCFMQENANTRVVRAVLFNTDIRTPEPATGLSPDYLPRGEIHLNVTVALLRFAKALTPPTTH